MKILFIHVPAALMAINAWLMMLVASLIWFVRRQPRLGARRPRRGAGRARPSRVVALLTGAIWGQPMWGTWWAWDPRLTSFFILFLFYLGYIALWEAVDEPDKAADLTAVLCLVGSVFALLSRYAVFFWSQGLHQGPSLSLDRAGERARRLLVAARPLDRRVRAALRQPGAAPDPHRDPRPADPRAGTRSRRARDARRSTPATVLGAYGVDAGADRRRWSRSSLWRAERVRRALADLEARAGGRRDDAA